jgi:hypothetical protein
LDRKGYGRGRRRARRLGHGRHQELLQGSLGTVLRYRRDFNPSASLGLFITDREGEGFRGRGIIHAAQDYALKQGARTLFAKLGYALIL